MKTLLLLLLALCGCTAKITYDSKPSQTNPMTAAPRVVVLGFEVTTNRMFGEEVIGANRVVSCFDVPVTNYIIGFYDGFTPIELMRTAVKPAMRP